MKGEEGGKANGALLFFLSEFFFFYVTLLRFITGWLAVNY